MKAMTEAEQTDHRLNTNAIRNALSILRLSRVADEDVAVAKARLENWLSENDGRWAA